jgi:hypothetical protein
MNGIQALTDPLLKAYDDPEELWLPLLVRMLFKAFAQA